MPEKNQKTGTSFINVMRYPANLVELLYSYVFWFMELPYVRRVAKPARKYISAFLFLFLPYWPAAKPVETRPFSDLWRSCRRLLLIGFIAGLTLCLGGCLLVTFLDNRLWAASPLFNDMGINIYNFMDDWANLILYAFVVPCYVACGTAIIALCWKFQNQTFDKGGPGPTIVPLLEGTRPAFVGKPKHLVMLGLVVIAFTGYMAADYQINVLDVLSVNYSGLFKGGEVANQALPFLEYIMGPIKGHNFDLKPGPIMYWFLEKRSGGFSYNMSGYFYIYLHYVLLLFTVTSVLIFLSAAFSVANLRDRIEREEFKLFSNLEAQIGRYVLAFILAKWMFLAVVLNTYIWRGSLLGSVGSVDVTIIAYAIIGSFLLSISNRILEIFWYSRQRQKFVSSGCSNKYERPSFQSIVPSGWPMVLKNTANVLLGLVFIDTTEGLMARIFDVIKFVAT